MGDQLLRWMADQNYMVIEQNVQPSAMVKILIRVLQVIDYARPTYQFQFHSDLALIKKRKRTKRKTTKQQIVICETRQHTLMMMMQECSLHSRPTKFIPHTC